MVLRIVATTTDAAQTSQMLQSTVSKDAIWDHKLYRLYRVHRLQSAQFQISKILMILMILMILKILLILVIPRDFNTTIEGSHPPCKEELVAVAVLLQFYY